LQSLFGVVANGGSIAAVGIFHAKLDLDPNTVVERELSLIGCSAFADELPEAIALLPKLADDLRRLIDREIRLEDVPAAYQRLIRGEATGLKTIVRPSTDLPR
jgi:(R,R)-butanediol dehydrogenase/meso-butanediol dehydrogenase/diacetyl reductase